MNAAAKKNDNVKEYVQTKQQNTYLKGAAKVGGTNDDNILMGFTADDDEDTRGARKDQGQRGGRRQNAKAALKKTEEDFPTL